MLRAVLPCFITTASSCDMSVDESVLDLFKTINKSPANSTLTLHATAGNGPLVEALPMQGYPTTLNADQAQRLQGISLN